MTNKNLSLQSLPGTQAHLCLKIEKICRCKLGMSGGRHLLAVSGGSDSVALLVLMHLLQKRLRSTFAVLHIDHQIRKVSAEDAAFVENLCSNLQIPFHLERIDVPKLSSSCKCGLEEAGRLARYALFEKYIHESGFTSVLLAHHSNDLLEDIMLRLLRGCGWPALGGMSWKNGYIGRPLLHEDPQSLKELLHSCGFGWREDETNRDLSYRRNRIRHLLLPLMRRENASITNAACRMHKQAELDSEYWHLEIERLLAENSIRMQKHNSSNEIRVPVLLLKNIHKALRYRLFTYILDNLRHASSLTGQNRLDTVQAIDEIIQSGTGGKVIQCSGGIIARVDKGDIRFTTLPKVDQTSFQQEK